MEVSNSQVMQMLILPKWMNGPFTNKYVATLLLALAHMNQTATIVLGLVCLSTHQSICLSVYHTFSRPGDTATTIGLIDFILFKARSF